VELPKDRLLFEVRSRLEWVERILNRCLWHRSDSAPSDKLASIGVLLLLGLAATTAAVVVPVANSYACQWGQTFEFDGCVPSPLLYPWNNSSPTAVESPHSCIWDMPWGRVSMPCNLMNCQTIIYPQPYTLRSQPVSCSSLTVIVRELVNGVTVPIKNHDVLVTANLTCEGAIAEFELPSYINVTMDERTNSSGDVSFLIPSSLGSSGSQSWSVNCYTMNWDDTPQGSGLTARDLNSTAVSPVIRWPPQQMNLAIWLPSISTRPHYGLGRWLFIL